MKEHHRFNLQMAKAEYDLLIKLKYPWLSGMF